MEESGRKEEFKRNVVLEDFLKDINGVLEHSEAVCLNGEIKEYPVIFVMSPGRTGSTLMVQWLASLGCFAYPTNLLSRFYKAPIVGAKIQRLLTDPALRFRDEFYDMATESLGEAFFGSENGKTKGLLSPNEFWYFWRRFVPERLWEYNSDDLWESSETDSCRRELMGVATEFGRPIAMKGMIFNYHIPFLYRLFPKSIFLCMSRDLDDNIESMRGARIRQYGTDEQWYSFHIPEYDELIKISDVREQIRGQLLAIYRAIADGASRIPESQVIDVKYEEFCEKPGVYYAKLVEALKSVGFAIPAEYSGVGSFVVHRTGGVRSDGERKNQ